MITIAEFAEVLHGEKCPLPSLRACPFHSSVAFEDAAQALIIYVGREIATPTPDENT